MGEILPSVEAQEECQCSTTAFRLAELVKRKHPAVSGLPSTEKAKLEGAFPFDRKEAVERENLQVFWHTHPRHVYDDNLFRCVDPDGRDFKDFWLVRLMDGLFGPVGPVDLCQIPSILAGQLDSPEHKHRASELIRENVVFYSQDILATEDLSTSPIHGVVPSVFIHATAFDNLLRAESRYLTDKLKIGTWSLSSTAVDYIIAIVLVFLMINVGECFKDRARNAVQRQHAIKPEDQPAGSDSCKLHIEKKTYKKLLLRYFIIAIGMVICSTLLILGIEFIFLTTVDYAGFNWVKILTMAGLVFFIELVDLGDGTANLLRDFCVYCGRKIRRDI